MTVRWNIYIAEISFVEGDTSKLRPVMVISEPVGEHKIALVAPIYSAKHDHKLNGDIRVLDNHKALGLIRPSTIRLHRMVALSTADLREQLGTATLELQKAVKVELQNLLQL